ncbi:MAG: YgiQ family radical SAM protein [Bacteroidales bacterium]|nr:YgiQ family radical SAM protein [Bacteroidales bacterium]MDT8429995.1 YgiQ family radical SAM protein [Bacteroidales bacterium]
MANFSITNWLPTTPKEVKAREWDELDIILFSGDAYIDHPSFGIPVIGRILEDAGFRVAIVPQPNWQDDLRDFTKLGKPRLFFGVSAGAMDSMVNHYTARKRRRSTDAYTPGNVSGFRPDYPSLVYTAALKKCFPDVPVILGGVEASLRRLTHYDYWKDTLQESILFTAGADMIVYGMGEASILQIARLADRGVPFRQITNLKQTVVSCAKTERDAIIGKQRYAELHSHADCLADKRKYAENFATIEIASNMSHPDVIVQECGDQLVVVNPPYPVMVEKQLDRIYDLPYTRLPHPRYRNKPPIPAYEMIRHSINTHRGCFGGCSFCTISAHQGKFISSRSEASIIREVQKVTEMEDFKGYISDMGGPSANMYRMKGRTQKVCDVCQRPSCLHPSICRNLDTDHAPLTALYKKAARVSGVKKVTIGSGIRYDFLDQEEEKNHFREYFSDIVKHHVSGRLKVAPEHTDPKILEHMRKPDYSLFRELTQEFNRINREEGMQQQIIPYFISSHPECTPEEMAELAVMTKDQGFRLEQVQDFTPTPMTLATVMYHSGYDPYTLEKVVTAKSVREKARQVIFFFWYKKEYRKQIRDELVQMGREDLIPKLLEQQ